MSQLLPPWPRSIQYLDVCLHIDPYQTPMVHNWVMTDPEIRMGDAFAAMAEEALRHARQEESDRIPPALSPMPRRRVRVRLSSITHPKLTEWMESTRDAPDREVRFLRLVEQGVLIRIGHVPCHQQRSVR